MSPVLLSPAVPLAWTVELDANPDTTGQFVLDSSVLDGTDVLAPDTNWIDVGQVVRRLSIRRGRSDESRPYDAAEAVVEFENLSGDFDPDNMQGRYVLLGTVKLLGVGTGLRIKANPDTVMFTGKVDLPDFADSQFDSTATYTAVDLLAELGQTPVPMQGGATGQGDSSHDRAKWLLDMAGVPDVMRSVEAGGRPLLATTGEGTVRDALQKVADGEAGRFYVTRDGVVTLTWHDQEYLRRTEATFTDDGTGIEYANVTVSPGRVDSVTNVATVKRTGPRVRNAITGQFEDSVTIPDVGAADTDSVAQYGTRKTDIACLLRDDADAVALARYAATRRSQPTRRLTKLTTTPLETMPMADAQAILRLDIGSMVTVVRHTLDGRELTFPVTVEGIRIDADPMATVVTLSTAPADTAGLYGGSGWFILDSSALDGADVLAPF